MKTMLQGYMYILCYCLYTSSFTFFVIFFDAKQTFTVQTDVSVTKISSLA